MSSLLSSTALAVVALMVLTWILSAVRHDASIVDIVWGLGFALISWVAWAVEGTGGTRRLLLALATTLWGLRLGGYLAWRNLGKGEDYRYKAMRKRYGSRFTIISLVSVFGIQGVLMWLVSLPVQLGQRPGGPSGLDIWSVIGLVVFAIGLAFEAIGDAQLARFKADPANAGRVMDRGLWSWTRHPNYFGDACVWTGLWLIAAATPVARWAFLSPILMTYLLVRVSGVAMLERTIGRRRLGYDEYVRKTSAFFPRPPKQTP